MPDSPLTINYPTSLDTVVSLGELNNRAATTLSASIVTGDLSLPLTDSTGFPATGVVTLVDSLTAPTKIEDIIYTANAANTLTVPAGGRGAFGTTAQNWSGTVYVRMRYLAEHHEALRDGLLAMETKLGRDASLPAVGKQLVGTASGSAWQDRTYRHVQGVAATVWTITHNLACRPSVTVVDSAGTLVIGQVEYLDDNNVRLTFSAAFGGEAYLN